MESAYPMTEKPYFPSFQVSAWCMDLVNRCSGLLYLRKNALLISLTTNSKIWVVAWDGNSAICTSSSNVVFAFAKTCRLFVILKGSSWFGLAGCECRNFRKISSLSASVMCRTRACHIFDACLLLFKPWQLAQSAERCLLARFARLNKPSTYLTVMVIMSRHVMQWHHCHEFWKPYHKISANPVTILSGFGCWHSSNQICTSLGELGRERQRYYNASASQQLWSHLS